MSYFENKHLDFVVKHYRKGVFDTQRALDKFKREHHIETEEKAKKAPHWIWYASSIAAVLVIGLFIWHFQATNLITLTAENSDTTYTLPDQSVIDLHQGSTLSYKKASFGKKTRKVKMDGTIFFKVNPNPDKPFEITGTGSFVRVLGTEFQIKEDKQHTELYVVEGKVLFARAEDTEGMFLTKGMQAYLDRTSIHPLLSDQADPNTIAWKRGTFIFDNTPIEEVLATLSDFYHIQLECKDKDKHLTGEFDVEEPEMIIGLIETALDVIISQK